MITTTWYDFIKKILIGEDVFDGFVKPTLNLPLGSKIFSIGCCVTNDIEALYSHLYDFPKSDFKGRADERSDVPASFIKLREGIAFSGRGVLNKFTVPNMNKELEWVLSNPTREDTEREFMFTLSNGDVIDLGMRGLLPVSYERFHERRLETLDLYLTIAECDAIVIMPHHNVQYYYKDTRIEHHPLNEELANSGFITSENLSQEKSDNEIKKLIGYIKKMNPDIKIIVIQGYLGPNRMMGNNDTHIAIRSLEGRRIIQRSIETILEEENVYYFPLLEMFEPLGFYGMEDDFLHYTPKVLESMERQLMIFLGAGEWISSNK